MKLRAGALHELKPLRSTGVPSTITQLFKDETKLRRLLAENQLTYRKRIRVGAHEVVDKALYVWFEQQRARGALISGEMLKREASELAKLHGDEGFNPSEGWLGRWKHRHGVCFRRLHGEAADADSEGARTWLETTLPGLLSQFSPANTFNADETGLFYRSLRCGTFAMAGEQITWRQNPQNRVTFLCIVNMEGTYKKVHLCWHIERP